MPTHKPFSTLEAMKLFDFFDSATPTTTNWIFDYLIKQGIPSSTPITGSQSHKQWLAELLISLGQTEDKIRLFANKMRNAWRVRNYRQKNNIVSLSVSLDRSVTTQLSQMSKGKKKADVVTQLIEDNYREFLLSNERIKTKKNEAKEIRKMAQNNLEAKSLLNMNTPCDAANFSQLLASQKQKNEELREGMAKLYDIIFLAHGQNQKVDDQLLLQATKIYYRAFDK